MGAWSCLLSGEAPRFFFYYCQAGAKGVKTFISMKSNVTFKWVIFFPAIILLYLLISFIWMYISLFSVSHFSVNSLGDVDTDKLWNYALYLLIVPLIAGYILAVSIYKLCPLPQLGARILTAAYLLYAGSVYLRPKVWNIGSLAALWYDGIILCFLIYVSFEKVPDKKLA